MESSYVFFRKLNSIPRKCVGEKVTENQKSAQHQVGFTCSNFTSNSMCGKIVSLNAFSSETNRIQGKPSRNKRKTGWFNETLFCFRKSLFHFRHNWRLGVDNCIRCKSNHFYQRLKIQSLHSSIQAQNEYVYTRQNWITLSATTSFI